MKEPDFNVYIKILTIVILYFCNVNTCFAQKGQSEFKSFNQKEINKYKVANNTYNLLWYKDENRWFPEGDTLPYFVDEKEYKGVINYGIEFSAVDGRNFVFQENFTLYKLDVKIDKCKVNLNDSIIEVEGTIKGGWTSGFFKGMDRGIDIFIGKKQDTITPSYFQHLINPEIANITFKGEKVNTHIVLDTFPSFYMYDYDHIKTNDGAERNFKISSKVDENSILVFGLGSCFSEIFDLGELIFPKNSLILNKAHNDDISLDPVVIIRNNVQESKKTNLPKIEIPKYYLIIEKAENHILNKQYGKAKRQYDILLKDDYYVFARDMHNAVRTAIFSRDYKTAILWCEKLALKGVNLTYFNAEIFNRIKKNNLWIEFLKKYPMINEKYRKGLNETLINRLKELVIIDQTDYKKNAKGEIEKSELRKTTEFVDGELIALIEKEGFPTEEKVGVPISQDSLVVLKPSYHVLIYHSHQMNSSRLSEIKGIRLENAKNFKYDALRDNLEVYKKLGSTCLQIYKGNLYNNSTCILNERQIKKIAFGFNNEHRFILNAGEFIVIPFEYKIEAEDDIIFKEKFDFVMKLTDDWFFYEK